PHDGAIVTFIGKARQFSEGKKVLFLLYDVYESMAQRELEKICETAIKRWPLSRAIIAHRYGKVEIGEASVFIGVSAPHRVEAFEAAQFMINTIKKTVPIWKKEFYEDGSVWIDGGH
ncbi:MAG: molybdenum cofactor biosynthesis protein MoaE, partial [Spirochaetes bacterium]|nr:molybdenum cofactor biosynthesis protein MoaE [Spirochaetota bacterium]